MGRNLQQMYLWHELGKEAFLKRIHARMGELQEFRVPDAAEVFNVSNKQITAWIEEGLLYAVDVGVQDSRRIYRMNRVDVMRRAEQLANGM